MTTPAIALSQRMTFLREQYGAALLAAFRSDERNAGLLDTLAGLSGTDAANALFTRVRDADPTPTGSCTQWMLRQAIAGHLNADDLDLARPRLEAFERYKRRLPDGQRDLGRFTTLDDVWSAVEPLVLANAATSARDAERRERAAVRAETDLLLNEDKWLIAIPRTERAAIWWGRGTKWCTSADDRNKFETYNRHGPLTVFVRPDGKKFQFHARGACS